MSMFTLGLSMAVSLVAAIGAAFLWKSVALPGKKKQVAAAGAMVLLGSWGILGTLRFLPAAHVDVVIVSPYTGSLETRTATVKGWVNPPDARVQVLVHPQDADRWWVQDLVLSDSETGRWSAMVRLGTEHVGQGQTFVVVAVGSVDEWPFDALSGRWHPVGTELKRLPLLSSSNMIILRRKPDPRPETLEETN